MKIAIIGATGQLGRCLLDEFKDFPGEVIGLNRNDIDLEQQDAIVETLVQIKPDFLINAAAHASVDVAEREPNRANLVNHLAVSTMAGVCKNINTHLVHVSTDYVFDGCSRSGYTEQCQPNPLNTYGSSKYEGEKAILNSACKSTIIRTSWLFSEYGNNFLKTMLKLSNTSDEIRVVGDQFGCPTYARHLAAAIKICLIQSESASYPSLFHYGGNSQCSWADFAENIFHQAMKMSLIFKRPQITKINSEEFPTVAERPHFSALNSSKFEHYYGVSPSDWKSGVSSTLRNLKAEC